MQLNPHWTNLGIPTNRIVRADDGGDGGDGGEGGGGGGGDAAEAIKEAVTAAVAEAKTDWDKAHKPPDTPDWRASMAGDDKDRLKTLGRFTDSKAFMDSTEALRADFSKGGLIRIPGKDASEEETAAYRQATGVPDKFESYSENLTLPDGVVMGDADKPIFESFAEAAHKYGVPQSAVDGLFGDWYQGMQTKQTDDFIKADESFHTESDALLRKEWGGEFELNQSAGALMFKDEPGGGSVEDEEGTMARFMYGRTSDGRVIADDPQIMRWLVKMGRATNPLVTIPGMAAGDVQGMKARRVEIEEMMKNKPSDYWGSEAVQQEYRELLAAEIQMGDNKS